MIAKILSANLAEVCPIDGVSIGRKDNKSTWRVDFRSIRAIRAYIASRSDATSDIHALEAEATDQRKKLRPYTALT